MPTAELLTARVVTRGRSGEPTHLGEPIERGRHEDPQEEAEALTPDTLSDGQPLSTEVPKTALPMPVVGDTLEVAEEKLIRATLDHYSHLPLHRVAKMLGMGVRTLGMKRKLWRDREAAAQASLTTAASTALMAAVG